MIFELSHLKKRFFILTQFFAIHFATLLKLTFISSQVSVPDLTKSKFVLAALKGFRYFQIYRFHFMVKFLPQAVIVFHLTMPWNQIFHHHFGFMSRIDHDREKFWKSIFSKSTHITCEDLKFSSWKFLVKKQI